MNDVAVRKEFLDKFLSYGEDKFYKFIIVYGLEKVILMKDKKYDGISPDLELLGFYEKFLIFYRRDQDADLLVIARSFRRAAHKIRRIMVKQGLPTKQNNKFLFLCKLKK